MCATQYPNAGNTLGPDDEVDQISHMLRDLEVALSLGASRDVIGSALEVLSRSLARHARRTHSHRELLRRLLRLRSDWRRGGSWLEWRTFNGLKAGWESSLH